MTLFHTRLVNLKPSLLKKYKDVTDYRHCPHIMSTELATEYNETVENVENVIDIIASTCFTVAETEKVLHCYDCIAVSGPLEDLVRHYFDVNIELENSI